MRIALGCLLLAGVAAFGQADQAARQAALKVDTILGALADPAAPRAALSQQLAEVILSLAKQDHQPSRGTVLAFTDELTRGLIGKDLKNAPQSWLLGSISEILNTSGANFTKASRLGDTLKILGVDPSKVHFITTRFIKIGEEVRGPDDLEARPPRVTQPLK